MALSSRSDPFVALMAYRLDQISCVEYDKHLSDVVEDSTAEPRGPIRVKQSPD